MIPARLSPLSIPRAILPNVLLIQVTAFSPRQVICRGGNQRPCYKFVYFHDVLRRVSFHEALQSCRRDGGDLLSIESPSEQRLIEKVIGSFSASDGDFWIGLTREENLGNSTECPDSYFWSDGSSFPFRNWYADEPSCGSEVCVVMYHQPSAPDGDGGPYMFQWNDDRCGMKNNFICKYAQGRLVQGPVSYGVGSSCIQEKMWRIGEHFRSLEYLLIPGIPVLLLLLVVTAIFIFWLHAKRRREQTAVSTKACDSWMSLKSQASSRLEVHNVIQKQSEADLAGTRSEIKNSSFWAHLPLWVSAYGNV
uniref:Layilin n=1 Tax=Varanus komodoensis TaxID=61221 RepID=A0A8D2LQ75_VARKO